MTRFDKSLIWFRRDFRLRDNPALYEAADQSDKILPLYIDFQRDEWPESRRHRWWRYQSLRKLSESLREHELELFVKEGSPLEILNEVFSGSGIDAVFWNGDFRPLYRRQDQALLENAEQLGVSAQPRRGNFLHHPNEIETTSGGPYHVFTPFWRKFNKQIDVPEPVGLPPLNNAELLEPSFEPNSLSELYNDAKPTLAETWEPGEEAALERFESFLDESIADYDDDRDRPDRDGTSKISPRLRFGEIGIRRLWHEAQKTKTPLSEESVSSYLQELVWREFSYHLLFHYPEIPTTPLKDKFKGFRWRQDDEQLDRWMSGKTGYPLVDAGMRQLKKTGWMHNRVRMVVASFLTKDLRINWLEGARWFWHQLVDADLANNTMGWQWAAGCGADAQPFFRIFNPIKQGEKHDPEGAYIRRFLPELRDVSDKFIHRPWKTSISGYPNPIVDHSEARERALAEWERIK